jgi:hypothetical protein
MDQFDKIRMWSLEEELSARRSEKLGTHDTLTTAGYVDALHNLRREIDRLKQLQAVPPRTQET